MPEPRTKALATAIKNGWKKLALADQSDADELAKVIKELLEELEAIDESAE